MDPQTKLREALLTIKEMVEEARESGQWSSRRGEVAVLFGQEWLGIDLCPWPNCFGEADRTSWIVTRGSQRIRVRELMLHYAKAGHWISTQDISEEDQKTLLEFFAD